MESLQGFIKGREGNIQYSIAKTQIGGKTRPIMVYTLPSTEFRELNEPALTNV